MSVVRERPVGVGGADVHVGLGRHPGVADRVRAAKPAEVVLLGHDGRVAEVLDQLEGAAEGEDLRALHVLDVAREMLEVTVVRDHVERVAYSVAAARSLTSTPSSASRRSTSSSRSRIFRVDVEPGSHVFLLGDLEPHHVVAFGGRPVDREAGGIGPAVLQGPCSIEVISAPMPLRPPRCMTPAIPHMFRLPFGNRGGWSATAAGIPRAAPPPPAFVPRGRRPGGSGQAIEIRLHVPLGAGVEETLPLVRACTLRRAGTSPRGARSGPRRRFLSASSESPRVIGSRLTCLPSSIAW